MQNTLLARYIHSGSIAFLLFTGLALHAGTVAVFNTGVDASGVPLADQQFDPHYLLVGRTTAPYATYSYGNAFPFQVWLPDSSLSKWISPQPEYSGFRSDPPGVYDFRTTFDLTGIDPSTV